MAGKTVICPECQTRFKPKGIPRAVAMVTEVRGLPPWFLPVVIPAGVLLLCGVVAIIFAYRASANAPEGRIVGTWKSPNYFDFYEQPYLCTFSSLAPDGVGEVQFQLASLGFINPGYRKGGRWRWTDRESGRFEITWDGGGRSTPYFLAGSNKMRIEGRDFYRTYR